MRKVGVLVDVIGRFGRGVLEGVTEYSWVHRGLRLTTPSQVAFATQDHWKDWQVDGLIVQGGPESLEQIKSKNVPTVNVSTHLEGAGLVSVMMDNEAFGRAAAEYFVDRGFRQLAYVGSGSKFAVRRGDAFEARAREAGLPCARPEIEVHLAWEGSRARTDLETWLKGLPRPTGLFVPNDTLALTVLEACGDAGVAVPEHVAVLGCDNDELVYRRTQPALSSIGVPASRIGYLAAQTLMELMEGRKVPAVQLLGPTQVFTRESTDLLAMDDEEVSEAVRFIRLNSHRPLGVQDVLAVVPMSRRLLEQRFRAALGRTLLEEIRRQQIERAQQLLAETDLKMPELAARCGFADSSYLGKLFHRRLGITPTEYRQQMRIGRRGGPV